MAETNRKYASERMRKKNPMANPEIRAKMAATLQAIKHGPKIRGGNGRPPTAAEEVLALLLDGLGFIPQYPIRTGFATGNGVYPPAYKPDQANPILKIAIEADGYSHCSLERQAQDLKKDNFLTGRGWIVLRFTNAEILTRPDQVMGKVLSTISKLKGCTLT